MKESLGIILSCYLFFVCGVTSSIASGNGNFLVACNKLGEVAQVGKTLEKFDRIDGNFRLDMETIELGEYGFHGVKIPKFKYDNIINLSEIGYDGIRFLPKGASIYVGDEIGITVLISEMHHLTRNVLKTILKPIDFISYKDISMFDFFVESLGINKGELRCDDQKKAVSMFAASMVRPFYGNKNTEVYYLIDINALMLVPKDDILGHIRFIFPKGLDSHMDVIVSADWAELMSVVNTLGKVEPEFRQGKK
jgi:hypothetical protein